MTAQRSVGRLASFAISVAVFGITQGPAFGQNILPPQILDPAVRTAQPPPQARAGDVLAPPEPGACPLQSSDLQFTLNSVEFTGAPDFPPQELAASYAGLIGRQVPVSTICEIRDRATTILFQRGLLARVEVPEQTIMDGHLSLEVIEAYVASIQVHGDAGPAQQKVEDYIEMLRGLRPFDINKAQRYLLLASDIPGISIAATFRASPQGRGAVEMDVMVSRVPFGAVFNANNFGGKSGGRVGVLARADLNSFSSYGERTSIIGYSTFDGNWREQQVVQAVEEARFGSGGLWGRLSLAYGSTHPGDILKPLGIVGTSYLADARLAYPIIRERSLNAALSGGFDYVLQNVNVVSTPLTRDRLSIWFARLSVNKAYAIVPVTVGGGIELRRGVVGFLGSSHAGERYLSRIEAHPDALVTRADGRIAVQWLPLVSSIATFQGQFSNVPLLAYEEFATGNLTIGRGYDPSVISGDSGAGASAEIRIGPFTQAALTSFGFFDIAKVWNKDTAGIDRSLRSVGGGFSALIARRIRIEVFYAQPLDKVSDLAASKPSGRLMFNLTVGF